MTIAKKSKASALLVEYALDPFSILPAAAEIRAWIHPPKTLTA